MTRWGAKSLARWAAAIGLAGLLASCIPPATATSTAKATTTAAASSNTLTGWLHTSGSKIEDAQNHPVTIRAVNWFGLETSNCAPHGLWTISLDGALAQIRSFGFNAIRLPYANQCLNPGATTSGIDFSQNPGLQGKSPIQVMDAVVKSAAAHGLKVILDQHRPDTGSQSELWYTSAYPESRWLSDWRMLATRYRTNNTVIGVDLHNEPHGSACWGCGIASRDWAAAATRGGNAVLAANPNLLILVEGIDQSAGTTTWWGGGLGDARTKPIRLSKAGHLVYSPHDYPSSIYAQSWFSAPNYPANLPSVWDRNWGYLQTTGTAPVLLGEFGTLDQTTSDKQWLSTIVSYLSRDGMSFAYWDYNPNSGDTGGLVADDWRTPETAKLNALKPILGARTTVVPTPVKQPSAPAPVVTPTKPSVPAPSTTSNGASASWDLQSSWQSGPGSYGYVAQLVISSTSTKTNWSVSWPDAGAKSVANAWGMTCSVVSHRVTCTAADWARTVKPGQPVTVGLQVSSSAAGPAHPSLTLTSS